MKLLLEGRCSHQINDAASCKLSATRKECLSNNCVAKSRTSTLPAFPVRRTAIQGGDGLGEVDAMRFLLGFTFGAFYTGNRAFRAAVLLIILIMVFWLYQISKPLSHNRLVASPRPEAR
jgi:hypothetical protein